MTILRARHAGWVILTILALTASGPTLSAQRTFRDLTGTVTDGHQEPLRGAVVQVECQTLGTVISYITTRSGQYSFKRLDGKLDYTVWATWRGQRSATRKISLFDASPAKVIDLTISPAP